MTPSVADISDKQLVWRAVRSLRRPVKSGGQTLGQAVMWTFGLGSTYAAQLCRRFDFDPDERVRK